MSRCPHCNGRIVDIPSQVTENARNYGEKTSAIDCGKCGKTMIIATKIIVEIRVYGKAEEGRESEWFEPVKVY